MTMTLRFGLLLGIALNAGCTESRSGAVVSTPVWTARNVKGYVETVAGPPPETAYGWDLHVTGDVAQWRECSSAEQCGDVERERPAADLIGFARVGRIERDNGHEVDVLSLSLAPHRRYVVPPKLP
jgi:hypothetical protein